MGEAKRRRKLDPNYGKQRYSVNLLKAPANSYCYCFVKDEITGKYANIDFHLFYKKGKLYAEAMTTRSENEWIFEGINQISPLVCKKVLNWADVLIT